MTEEELQIKLDEALGRIEELEENLENALTAINITQEAADDKAVILAIVQEVWEHIEYNKINHLTLDTKQDIANYLKKEILDAF